MAFKFRQTCQRSYGHLRQFVAPVEVEQRSPAKQKGAQTSHHQEQETEEVEREQELEDDDLDGSQYEEGETEEPGRSRPTTLLTISKRASS